MNAESLARIYDGFAASYARNRDVFDLGEVLRAFSSGLPDSGDLCDLGCGAGEPVSAYFVS